MTREEAIEYFESLLKRFEEMYETETSYWGKAHTETTIEATRLALSALRPVSRERVEKVWRGEWNQDEHGRVVCNRCGSIAAIGTENALHNAKKYDRFCFYCGAPMTDEAVEMVMERINKMEGMENESC